MSTPKDELMNEPVDHSTKDASFGAVTSHPQSANPATVLCSGPARRLARQCRGKASMYRLLLARVKLLPKAIRADFTYGSSFIPTTEK